MRLLKTLVPTLVLFAVPLAATAQASGEVGIPLGSIPELVEVEDLDGNPVSLAEFAGDKPLLVEFWAYWCENCAELHPRLVETYRKYNDRIEFLAVGVGVAQSPRRIRRHLEGLEPPVEWTTLYDRRGRAVRSFKPPATSFVAILDTDGTVVYTGIGPDQDIEAAVLAAIEGTE